VAVAQKTKSPANGALVNSRCLKPGTPAKQLVNLGARNTAKPQRLKPSLFQARTARLKSCPSQSIPYRTGRRSFAGGISNIRDDSKPNFVKVLDIHMMTPVAGRQRTWEEFEKLLEPCGFRLEREIDVGGDFSILEAAVV